MLRPKTERASVKFPLDTGKSRPAKPTYSIGEAVSLMEVKHGWQRQRSFGNDDLFQRQNIHREALIVDRSDMSQDGRLVEASSAIS